MRQNRNLKIQIAENYKKAAFIEFCLQNTIKPNKLCLNKLKMNWMGARNKNSN